EIIRRQAEHMARLVSDLLDVSRITRGNLTVQKKPLDLVEIVRRCILDYQEGLRKGGIRVELSLPDAPVIVCGDQVRLFQAIGNLMSNAGKFSPPGGLITVQLRRGVLQEGEQAIVAVRDTGAGIPPAALPRIWES